MSWQIKRTDNNCHTLNLDNKKKVTKRRILLLADIHWDNSHCDLKQLKKDLEQAKKDSIPVFIFGDFFCAMQGKYDPRSSQDALRPEHRGGNYLDLLVETATEWLMPYKDQLALITPGNHETSILKRHETNLTERLVTLLRHSGSKVEMGSYWGFVKATMGYDSTRSMGSINIHYSHGYGGGGEITRGLIDWSRVRGQYIADVYVSGHIHRRNCDENVITSLTSAGSIKQSRQLFLRCGTYKDEHQPNGYHVEKGRAGRPIGGWWLEIESSYTAGENNPSLDIVAVMT